MGWWVALPARAGRQAGKFSKVVAVALLAGAVTVATGAAGVGTSGATGVGTRGAAGVGTRGAICGGCN